MPNAPTMPLDLSVLVPVYNEAGNIEPLVAEIMAAIAPLGITFEIILVDDGSSDGGPAEMAAAKARHAGLRVIRHENRAGKSAALVTGAHAARGAWIQTLDGDGQNDPADTARLWGTIAAAPPRLGIVAGQRTSRNDGTFKWLQSRIANGVRRRLLQDGTRDTGCGFKLVRREALLAVPFFDGMHRFLPALVRRAGYEVIEAPVADRPRGAGRSKYGFLGRLGAGVVDLLGVIWLLRRATLPRTVTGDL